ncbi:hypothetical protein TEA_012779 [Camellia sinensis var. sinensis]|uniref:Uncharacterized protein n=1 Tax=Camellia sinensis var. sinensis TaxID=542762 RepID=A0A4S4ETZ4_CAMSN|nr:hypothetical protein TEA_012779 [Camellia sinensis var. sinensis]
MSFIKRGSTNSIDNDRRERSNRIRVKGLAQGQLVSHNINRNYVMGFAQGHPINHNVLIQSSCYQYDSEDDSEDELFEDYGEYQSVKRQRRFSDVFNSNNCINHDFSYYQVPPEISYFNASYHVEDFIYWFRKVDKFLECMEIFEEKQAKNVTGKLQGYVSTWWNQLQYD